MANVPKKLTPKERLFVAEYLVTLNGADAYCKAGYKASTKAAASSAAWKLLRKPHIAAAVAAGQAKKLEKAEVTADRVLAELAKIGFGSMRQFVTIDADGQPQINLSHTPNDDLDALSDVQTETVLERSGTGEDGRPEYNSIRKTKIKLHDKLGALKLLADHTNLFASSDKRKATDLADAFAQILAAGSRAPLKSEGRK